MDILSHYKFSKEEIEEIADGAILYDFQKMGSLHKLRQRDGHYRNRNGTKGKNPNRTTQHRNFNGLDNLL